MQDIISARGLQMEAPLQRRPERCYKHSARRPQQYALLYKWRQRKSAGNQPEA
jgi:hypothetical protein